jgi:hypothetical protein
MNPSAGDRHWIRNEDGKRVRILDVRDNVITAKPPHFSPYQMTFRRFIRNHRPQ